MNRHERIARAIALSGMKKGEIAKACAVANSAVTQWISGESKSLKPENLYALAKATGFRAEWLAIGTGPEKDVESNVEPALGPSRYFEYPEISWVQAGAAIQSVERSNIATCEKHPSDAWAGPDGFWLKVKGPSMTAQGGVSFNEGMVILVAPGFDVESGQYVVAKLIDTDEATFKQFIWDSGRGFLKPLNPAFPTVEIDDSWLVVGRVVDAKWPRSVL